MLLSASLAVGEAALSPVLRGEQGRPGSPASPVWALEPHSQTLSLAPPRPHPRFPPLPVRLCLGPVFSPLVLAPALEWLRGSSLLVFPVAHCEASSSSLAARSPAPPPQPSQQPPRAQLCGLLIGPKSRSAHVPVPPPVSRLLLLLVIWSSLPQELVEGGKAGFGGGLRARRSSGHACLRRFNGVAGVGG